VCVPAEEVWAYVGGDEGTPEVEDALDADLNFADEEGIGSQL
jgi:hypothetical protein